MEMKYIRITSDAHVVSINIEGNVLVFDEIQIIGGDIKPIECKLIAKSKSEITYSATFKIWAYLPLTTIKEKRQNIRTPDGEPYHATNLSAFDKICIEAKSNNYFDFILGYYFASS